MSYLTDSVNEYADKSRADLSCVPLDELPIQQVLYFDAPLDNQAVSYLQAIALRHGHQLSSNCARQLYASTAGDEGVQWTTSRLCTPASGPLHPATMLASVDKSRGAAKGVSLDLRHAIMQLQFLCLSEEWDDEQGKASFDTQGMLREQIEKAEHRSYGDATFSQPFERACEVSKEWSCLLSSKTLTLTPLSSDPTQVLEPDEYANSGNDVQGQGSVLLYKPKVKMEAIILPSVSAEERYLEALGPCSSKLDCMVQFDLERQRASSRVDELLTALFVHPSSRVPSWESVIDYSPLIGNMIQADDQDEAAHQARMTQLLKEAQNGSIDTAGSSLLKMGIRPSRHATRLLLQRGSDGLLAVSRREADFSRWILVDKHLFEAARESRLSAV